MQKKSTGQTALHMAAEADAEGNASDLVQYLIVKGADFSIVDEMGRTPLFVAETMGHTSLKPCRRANFHV